MAKSKRTICPLAYQSDDTPKLIASKSTLKSMIFRWNSSRNWSTKNPHAEGNCIQMWIRNSYSHWWRNHAKITRKWKICGKKSSKIWSLKIRHAGGKCTKTKVKKWKIDCSFLPRYSWVGCWVVGLTSSRTFSSKLNSVPHLQRWLLNFDCARVSTDVLDTFQCIYKKIFTRVLYAVYF